MLDGLLDEMEEIICCSTVNRVEMRWPPVSILGRSACAHGAMRTAIRREDDAVLQPREASGFCTVSARRAALNVGHKHVAAATNGLDVAWHGRVGFDQLAQAHHGHVDGACQQVAGARVRG